VRPTPRDRLPEVSDERRRLAAAIAFEIPERVPQDRVASRAACDREKAVAVDPENAQTPLSCGVALGLRGRVDEAIAESREAMRPRKGDPEAHCGLGVGWAFEHARQSPDRSAGRRRLSQRPGGLRP
jgi:hypothetical protein